MTREQNEEMIESLLEFVKRVSKGAANEKESEALPQVAQVLVETNQG